MRISCLKDDPGHVAFLNMFARGEIVVSLDGVDQRHVVTADDEAGTVLRHVLDANGEAQLDPKNPVEVWCETANGSVEISVR